MELLKKEQNKGRLIFWSGIILLVVAIIIGPPNGLFLFLISAAMIFLGGRIKRNAAAQLPRKSVKSKVIIGFTLLCALAVVYIIFPKHYSKSITIEANELGIEEFRTIINGRMNYQLNNENVIKELKKSGLTLEEFNKIVEVEIFVPDSGKYIVIEFISSRESTRNLTPIFNYIASDIIRFVKSKESLQLDSNRTAPSTL